MGHPLEGMKVAIVATDGVEREVVVDGSLTTSRSPHDLPAFCAAIVEQFSHARAETTVTAR
jgi:putative intracellular protease/amidase